MRAAGKPVFLLEDISEEAVEEAAEYLANALDPRPEVRDG